MVLLRQTPMQERWHDLITNTVIGCAHAAYSNISRKMTQYTWHCWMAILYCILLNMILTNVMFST